MPKKKESIGGIAFFFSYVVLTALAISNMRVIILVFPSADLFTLALVIGGLILGWWGGTTFMSGQISVLIHEYKHAILATFIGNKWKKIKLSGMSGVFHYSYTKDTAEYNVFISLAPYFLPVLTFFSILFYFVLKPHSIEAAYVLVSVLHGSELYFNLKDATPIQTDLTDVRGGYWVALGYIIVANIVISSAVFIWLIGGEEGLKLWAASFWTLGLYVVGLVRAAFLPSGA